MRALQPGSVQRRGALLGGIAWYTPCAMTPEYTPDYLLESFPAAVRTLVNGEKHARDRVQLAYQSIRHLQPERFPEPLRADFEWVMKELTKRTPERQKTTNRDGSISVEGLEDANLRVMKSRTASKIANRIYTIYQNILALAFEPLPGCHHKLPHV